MLPSSDTTHQLSELGGLGWRRAPLDASPARDCPDELRSLRLLGVVGRVQRAEKRLWSRTTDVSAISPNFLYLMLEIFLSADFL